MTLHKTADTLAWDESTGQFTYKLSVQGVGALRLAQPNGDLLYDAAPRAYLIPYPDVYSAAHQRPPITVSEGTGSLILTIKDSLPDAAKKGVLYQCYYNLTYYAFSDPDSGSSPWNIRRGITNQMYTQDTSYGGGIPISSCYYASATGSDANAGYLKEQPFKTLAKAVKAVREKNIPWIKTIVVLGELNWASESSAYYPGYQANANVFVIPDLQAGESAADLIRITGDPAFTGGVPAVLSGATGRRVLYIYGANIKIQFDHIEITRGNLTENAHGGGMWIGNGAQVALKAFSQINGNEASSAGGVWIESGGKLTLSENADIHHNKAKGLGYGGGVYMMNTDTAVPSLTMNGGTIRNNTALGGGGVNVNNGWFSMSNGSVRDNTVQPADGSRTQFGGGGVRIESGGLFYMTGGSLIDNMADGQRENVGYKSGANNYTDINADGYSTSGYNLVITDNIP
jgi:hypothetical protein